MNKENTLKAIEVMQAFADGKHIQCRRRGADGWRILQEHNDPLWDWSEFEYQIAVQKPSIDWSHVSPEYRFLAVDDDEYAHFYKHLPFLRAGDWQDSSDVKAYAPRAETFASYKRGDCHYSESLVERP